MLLCPSVLQVLRQKTLSLDLEGNLKALCWTVLSGTGEFC